MVKLKFPPGGNKKRNKKILKNVSEQPCKERPERWREYGTLVIYSIWSMALDMANIMLQRSSES